MGVDLSWVDLDLQEVNIFTDPKIKQRALELLCQQLGAARLSISDHAERKEPTSLGSPDEEGTSSASQDSLVITFQIVLDNYERLTVPGAVELQKAAEEDLTQRHEGQVDPQLVLLMQQRALIDARLQPHGG